MLCVVGTVPDPLFEAVSELVAFEDGCLSVAGRLLPVHRGTPALLAAAFQTLNTLGKPMIMTCLAGDIGLGTGSRNLYRTLADQGLAPEVTTLVFHYLQPDADWHSRVLFRIMDMKKPPVMIADAGFMYAAKMSGQAGAYDLFTPDAGELAFLADENAPHPFYTRGFILHTDNKVPDLVNRAYGHDNAARYLLVKGSVDYIADRSGILLTVDCPSTESMEAIGGTGDTLTGIVSALIESGMDIPAAAHAAAKINRMAGYLARPTPATPIHDIIARIPESVMQWMKP